MITILEGDILLDMPYFMKNEEWFYFDGSRFVLTESAPEEAKKSLQDFYKDEKRLSEMK